METPFVEVGKLFATEVPIAGLVIFAGLAAIGLALKFGSEQEWSNVWLCVGAAALCFLVLPTSVAAATSHCRDLYESDYGSYVDEKCQNIETFFQQCTKREGCVELSP